MKKALTGPIPKPAAQATRTVLRDARGTQFILTLQGANVMTGEGKGRNRENRLLHPRNKPVQMIDGKPFFY